VIAGGVPVHLDIVGGGDAKAPAVGLAGVVHVGEGVVGSGAEDGALEVSRSPLDAGCQRFAAGTVVGDLLAWGADELGRVDGASVTELAAVFQPAGMGELPLGAELVVPVRVDGDPGEAAGRVELPLPGDLIRAGIRAAVGVRGFRVEVPGVRGEIPVHDEPGVIHGLADVDVEAVERLAPLVTAATVLVGLEPVLVEREAAGLEKPMGLVGSLDVGEGHGSPVADGLADDPSALRGVVLDADEGLAGDDVPGDENWAWTVRRAVTPLMPP
jgi:hypothetical protein